MFYFLDYVLFEWCLGRVVWICGDLTGLWLRLLLVLLCCFATCVFVIVTVVCLWLFYLVLIGCVVVLLLIVLFTLFISTWFVILLLVCLFRCWVAMMILVFWFTLVGVFDVDCMVSYLLCEFWVWVFRFVGWRFSLLG